VRQDFQAEVNDLDRFPLSIDQLRSLLRFAASELDASVRANVAVDEPGVEVGEACRSVHRALVLLGAVEEDAPSRR
jgi:hypothetical protein